MLYLEFYKNDKIIFVKLNYLLFRTFVKLSRDNRYVEFIFVQKLNKNFNFNFIILSKTYFFMKIYDKKSLIFIIINI